jgi:hypothetical protein
MSPGIFRRASSEQGGPRGITTGGCGESPDKEIQFAVVDVYQFCPARHQKDWNLLDAVVPPL